VSRYQLDLSSKNSLRSQMWSLGSPRNTRSNKTTRKLILLPDRVPPASLRYWAYIYNTGHGAHKCSSPPMRTEMQRTAHNSINSLLMFSFLSHTQHFRFSPFVSELWTLTGYAYRSIWQKYITCARSMRLTRQSVLKSWRSLWCCTALLPTLQRKVLPPNSG
jgi:hypothetical protein